MTISAYQRHRERTGRAVPFPPPLPSPKHSGKLSLKQNLFLFGWDQALRAWSASLGRLYTSPRPIMLMGCHNSGTTILARLIAQHPAIVNWSEAPEVWGPDGTFLSWGVFDQPTLPTPFLFDPAAYTRNPDQHGHFIPSIRNAFSLYAALHGKRRFLNKNPHLCMSVPYIEAAFPDACYIHLRRNGYAVVQSLLSNWRPVLKQVQEAPESSGAWAKLRTAIDPIYFEDDLALVRLCARYWRDLDQAAENDLRALPAERVYFSDYQSLCLEPRRVLSEIFEQFGLNPSRYNWAQLEKPSRYPWSEMLPMEDRNFKYRERLTRAEIDAISAEVSETLAQYGYLDAPLEPITPLNAS